MIRAYFFDFGETLGYSGDDKGIRSLINARQNSSLLTTAFDDADVSKEHRDRIRAILLSNKQLIYPEVRDTISGLNSEGYGLAVVSNMYAITAQRLRDTYPLFLVEFDVVSLSAELGMKKPDPEIFRYTLNKLNDVREQDIIFPEVMMIGNNPKTDIEPAKGLGMQTKIIDRSVQTLRDVI